VGPFARQGLGWLGWTLLLAVLATQSGADARGSLAGLRGVLLVAATCALLVVAVKLEVPRILHGVAAWLGDLSYPLYLLHPVVYALALHRYLLLGWLRPHPVRFLVTVLLVSIVAATFTYRWFEAPILKWGKRRLAP
jgi:exopolysaccharide production protein ExoZ